MNLGPLLTTVLDGSWHFAESHHYSPIMSSAIIIAGLYLELSILYCIVRLLVCTIINTQSWMSLLARLCGLDAAVIPQTFLELSFPISTTKSAYATEQVHILLRSLVTYHGVGRYLAARKKPYSLELVSTNNDGIRYLLMVPTYEVDFVRRTLLSYLPGIKVQPTQDYLNHMRAPYSDVIELQLSSDYLLPLQAHKTLAEHDPIAYLTGHMTKLDHEDLIAFQIVVAPVLHVTHPRIMRRQRAVMRRIAMRQELSSQLVAQRSMSGSVLYMLWHLPIRLCSALALDANKAFSFNDQDESQKPKNPYEKELSARVKEKIDQPLYEVSMRIYVAASDPALLNDRLHAIASSFKLFTTTYQSIKIRNNDRWILTKERLSNSYQSRTLSPHYTDQPTILSSSELSDIYHFPYTLVTKTESLLKCRSPQLPAPISIRSSTNEFDSIVGINHHGGESQLLGLTRDQRLKHTYIIGKTGTGKTTLVKHAVYQDIVNGNGLALLDPHGDMFHELLEVIPENRRKDIVIFDPSDREWPIGLNILDPLIEFSSLDDKNDWITSTVISIFEKLASVEQWGPRMEHILRSSVMTVLQLPNPNLFTLQQLLTDKKFQKSTAAKLNDPVLKQFWKKEFALTGTMQLSSATAPLTHRLGHFMTAKMSRNILLQPKTSLNIADIMNEGKILLVNLSKGDLGEDQSSFFGTILTALIWMAAFQRTKLPERKRRDFFVYIDEFQNFATRQFADITSEGRKFHIGLTVSHQNIAQINDRSILNTIAGNAHNYICMKANPDDEAFILPYMTPSVKKGDIINLTLHHFFMKTTARDSEDAFSGVTLPMDEIASLETKQAAIDQSRSIYATPKAVVATYLGELFNEPRKTAIHKKQFLPPRLANQKDEI